MYALIKVYLKTEKNRGGRLNILKQKVSPHTLSEKGYRSVSM